MGRRLPGSRTLHPARIFFSIRYSSVETQQVGSRGASCAEARAPGCCAARRVARPPPHPCRRSRPRHAVRASTRPNGTPAQAELALHPNLLKDEVPRVYFPMRAGNRVTLYHDAHQTKGPVRDVSTQAGAVGARLSCCRADGTAGLRSELRGRSVAHLPAPQILLANGSPFCESSCW